MNGDDVTVIVGFVMSNLTIAATVWMVRNLLDRHRRERESRVNDALTASNAKLADGLVNARTTLKLIAQISRASDVRHMAEDEVDEISNVLIDRVADDKHLADTVKVELD